MRCLGIDHGTRRVGLSYGDDIGVATPLPALAFSDSVKQWAGIASVLRDRKITDIVVGHPLNMDGTSGSKAKEVEEFARKDPYVTGGLVTRWEVRSWAVVIGDDPPDASPKAVFGCTPVRIG